MDKYAFSSSLLNECLTNREAFLKKVMKDEKCTRDTAKTLVIAIINGAKYTSPTLKQLANELKPTIDYVINLPEYKDILDYVKANYKENIEGKTISRILQVIENNLLETYVEFFNDLIAFSINHNGAPVLQCNQSKMSTKPWDHKNLLHFKSVHVR